MRIKISKYKLGNKIKIVHLSDIHYDIRYNLKRFDLIISAVSKLKPDYICITGDIVDNSKVFNNKEAYQIFKKFILKLTNISKVIITLGNHEMKDGDILNYNKIVKLLKNIPNLVVLDNEIYFDNDINFIGFNPSYEYYKKPSDNLFIKEFNKQNFKLEKNNILLVHTPKNLLGDNIFNECKLNNYKLILSGHTHGGMAPIFLKGNRGIISPNNEILPKNVRGHLIRGNTHLIICSAIVRLSNNTGILSKFNDIYAMHINYIEI